MSPKLEKPVDWILIPHGEYGSCFSPVLLHQLHKLTLVTVLSSSVFSGQGADSPGISVSWERAGCCTHFAVVVLLKSANVLEMTEGPEEGPVQPRHQG